MDIFEAVDTRLSCRAFLSKPVDPAIVRTLVEQAARAASGGNLQPWQVYALAGAPLAELKRKVAASIAGKDPRVDSEIEYSIYPSELWEKESASPRRRDLRQRQWHELAMVKGGIAQTKPGDECPNLLGHKIRAPSWPADRDVIAVNWYRSRVWQPGVGSRLIDDGARRCRVGFEEYQVGQPASIRKGPVGYVQLA